MTRLIPFFGLTLIVLSSGCAHFDCYDEQDQSACYGRGHGHHGRHGDPCGGRGSGGGVAAYDRPFPLGAVNDTFWETQQTNAEAADFVFHDHEFRGETAQLAPGAKRHLEQVAMRWEHVPFPVLIEMSEYNAKPQLDRARRQAVIEQLARLGIHNPEGRVVIADAYTPGMPGVQAERMYYRSLGTRSGGGGGGGRFGGSGGTFR
jgi:hypothetical protein